MFRNCTPIGVLAVLLAGCSPATMGVNRMADALSKTASAYGSDDDPEFVRLGAPSTLKMVEMLLEDQPAHPGLLLTACRGYTQYSYAFLHVESELAAPASEAAALKQRALRMYDRARGYCQRALALRLPNVQAIDPKALAAATPGDVPVLYWMAASWGGSIAVADTPALRVAELAGVRALLRRAVELHADWEGGAIHEALIAVEGLPALLGGSAERARAHFARAVETSEGQSAFAYVALATSVAQPAKDRAEFERLLRQALAIDVRTRPSIRLANLIAQKRARFLLARAGSLF